MIALWPISLVALALGAWAYAVIAWRVAAHLRSGRQWRNNPLGVATVVVFVALSLTQAVHALYAMGAGSRAATDAARTVLGELTMAVWTSIAAAVAVAYLLQRRRLATLQGSHALVADLAERQEEAHRVQQEVLVRARNAHAALAAGDVQKGAGELEDLVAHAKGIVRDLLPSGGRVEPGEVRREAFDG